MLKIENYNKILGLEVGKWHVGEIFETNSAYLIQLWMQDDWKKMQVNLEKNPVGRQKEYELWCWNSKPQKTGPISPTATPIRTMLQKHNIQDIDKLMASIEFLIRNL